MKIRAFALIVALALGVLAAPVPAEAQKSGKVYRIAILGTFMLPELLPGNIWVTGVLTQINTLAVRCNPRGAVRRRMADTIGGGLCQGLRELGYFEEGDLKTFYAFEKDLLQSLPQLAAELVRSKIDVILAAGTRAALAAKKATRAIPIVFVEVPDPVGAGLVASLGRPGGNITGVTNMLAELGVKQLELLKEAVPTVSRVAILRDPTSSALVFKEMRVAAQALGMTLQSLEVQDANEFEPALSATTRERADALLLIPADTFVAFRNWIVDLTRQSHLPATFGRRGFVEAGGLMAYGPDLADLGRRTAALVHKILKGANPSDLPVEQPTKFELVINLKTAKALGLTIPPSLLFQADRVIK